MLYKGQYKKMHIWNNKELLIENEYVHMSLEMCWGGNSMPQVPVYNNSCFCDKFVLISIKSGPNLWNGHYIVLHRHWLQTMYVLPINASK